jgi:transketolase N-terminal domain/subunit
MNFYLHCSFHDWQLFHYINTRKAKPRHKSLLGNNGLRTENDIVIIVKGHSRFTVYCVLAVFD